jgi:uncharacterized membrane protein YbhN (UPF0104 family)
LRKTLVGLGVILLGAAMLVLLFEWSGITFADLGSRLSHSPVWLIPALMMLSVVQVMLSAVKWREVLATYGTEGGTPSLRFCIFQSTVANLLSQLVSIYLSSSVVRGAAARRSQSFSTSHGLASSAYEQLFDIAVMGIFVLATVTSWLLHGGMGLWIGFALAGVAICAGGMMSSGKILEGLGRIRLPGLVQPSVRRLGGAFTQKMFDWPLTRRLLALSLARYAVLVGRAALIAVAMGFVISPLAIAQAFTMVVATQFASLTPGNLGLQEWSWSALLSLRGTPLRVASEFAITYRVLTFVSMNLGMAALASVTWRNQRDPA